MENTLYALRLRLRLVNYNLTNLPSNHTNLLYPYIIRLYSIILYSIVLYSIVLYCIVLSIAVALIHVFQSGSEKYFLLCLWKKRTSKIQTKSQLKKESKPIDEYFSINSSMDNAHVYTTSTIYMYASGIMYIYRALGDAQQLPQQQPHNIYMPYIYTYIYIEVLS